MFFKNNDITPYNNEFDDNPQRLNQIDTYELIDIFTYNALDLKF